MSAGARPHAAAGAIALVFAALCARFAWQPGLATLADDSVSYLVMAQVLSPWQQASAAVAEAFVREAFYPPLFPLLLGAVGAGHDIARAHAVTALLLAGCLPPAYALGMRWLGSRWAAFGAVLALASLPSLWIHAKGILSEPLFMLLLLGAFLALESRADEPKRRWLLAAALAGLALTRTVGLVVVAGYALWALTRRGPGPRERAQSLLPVLAAVAAYGLWVLARPAGTSDDYMRIVAERGGAMLRADSPAGAFALSVLRQAIAMGQAWGGSLLVYWVRSDPTRLLLAWGIFLLALGGLAGRFVAGKADAWMTAAYLVTFLLWPFYDQMTRFLFPLLPALVLYALWAGGGIARRLRQPPAAAHAVLALLVLSLTVPALTFVYQRAKMDGHYGEIVDWYRTPDLEEARRRSQVHLDLMADMQAIQALTGPDDRIAWVVPSYVALLADRRALPMPAPELPAEAYRRAILDSGATYVFLSVYHPRDTLRDTAWRAGTAALRGRMETVRTRLSSTDGSVSSVLLKVRKE